MWAVRADTSDDAELARRATGGDGQAFGLLFDRWLDRAFDVAWHVVHNRETAADVTQEAFATAWQQIANLRQPESFGGWLLRITRNKALNRLQRERRSRPTGSEEALVTLDARQADDPSAPLEQREHGDLIRAASAALGQEDASLLSLHLRHDLGAPELAEELGVQPNAVHQRLFRLKKRLADAIGAWVLWRGGTPSCPELSEALARAEATSFDRGTAKAIVGHARGCDACDSRRQLRLSPEALFATMPLVPAGPVVRAKLVAALQGSNVPVPTDPTDPQPSDGATDSGDARGLEQADATSELEEPGGQSDASGHGEASASHDASAPDGADGVHDGGAPDDAKGLHDVGGQQDAGAPGGAGGPERSDTADVAQAPQSRQGRTAALVGGTVVVVLASVVVLLILLANGEGSTDEGRVSAATPSEVTDGRRGTTTTPTSDDPTTTADPTTTTTTATTPTTPADEVTAPAPAPSDSAAGTTVPADSTAPPAPSRDAPEPDGTGGGGREPAEPPTINRFTAGATNPQCGSAGEVEATFTWDTSDATSATLGPQGGSPAGVRPSGGVTRCARPGSTWTLTATGPGGTADAQATVPTSPALATP